MIYFNLLFRILMFKTLELLNTHIDFDAMLPEMNDQVRASYHRPLTDEEIACDGLCDIATPVWTRALQERFRSIGGLSLRAHSEVHEDNLAFHCYTVITSPEEPSDPTIIVDSTYKQFIPRKKRKNYPNIYVGTTSEIIQVLEEIGKQDYFANFYKGFTLSKNTPEDYHIEHGVYGPADGYLGSSRTY